MAGEGGGQLLRGGDVTGAGIGEAAVDPGQLGVGGGVFAGGEGGFDLGRIGCEFGLGLGGPGGGAGQGVGEGPVGHGAILAGWAGERSGFGGRGWLAFRRRSGWEGGRWRGRCVAGRCGGRRRIGG